MKKNVTMKENSLYSSEKSKKEENNQERDTKDASNRETLNKIIC
jgi:hypothetical protein